VPGIDLCDGAGETSLDSGDADEVREVAGVICCGKSSKDRVEEVEILSIDGERVLRCAASSGSTPRYRGWRRGMETWR
jgi:hypothetical protein